ncbi:hypothetical protein GCM10007301_50850 [Azorhizobium oxalatiphilum]|uniref:HTH tetR-type domain-containing protein n=1 Tax=Azorhizobium oxalatiphilum TaxID=980631 RepID=A0A917FI25_9HYPH|nr:MULTISPECIES: TetR/AcrR family transcriptional regulator [Alphaproteobacteria]ETI62864.1 TetR family transcriptional regulator [Sphingobium sp. C100]GGF84704.1 hypothetical protein GCM10007301_50850 [Azorhizobium oxalatiphilum]
MTARPSGKLKPRKRPVQARSLATIEAIFEATIQVLLHGGARALTTNRIAERAGVSVGTLYQYFPAKEALLYALVSRHLDKAGQAVEQACQAHSGASLSDCADTFVDAYIDAKAGDVAVSRALYHASTELDMQDLGAAMIARLHQAVRGLLEHVQGERFEPLDSIVFSWVAVVTGGTRVLFEEDGTAERLPAFRAQLKLISRAYLDSIRTIETKASSTPTGECQSNV